MSSRTGRERRWEVSAEELERISAARRSSIARSALLLVRAPRLIPDIARIVTSALRGAIFDNNALISLLDSERARVAVPDVATGVGWYDERPFLEALTPHLTADATVLELGCGGGRISRHVAPMVGELVCTDPSRAMVAEARENLAMFANVRVAATDGFALSEFTDGAFGIVFAQGVLGYLDPNQLLALLDEVRRVLRRGGVCVFNFFTIDNHANAQAHLATVRKMARRRRFHGGVDRAYTSAQIAAMYAAVGLRPIEPRPSEVGEPPGGRVTITGQS